MTTIETTSGPPPRGGDLSPDPTTLCVLIADDVSREGIERLRAAGCRVEVDPELEAKSLPAAVERIDPDVLLVRSTEVPAEVLEAGHRLSLIVRAGAGYDNIDVAAASARGVSVANCPGRNALAVAELAWSLILSCDRRVPDQTIDLRNGIWNKKLYGKSRGLYGRTLGVIGLGRIGLAVAERGRAFGMPVIGWSRSLTETGARALGIGYRSSPLEVARDADVVSLHVASKPETRHLVNAEFCAAMRPGAYLINTTRGAVVDEAALIAAIREKGIRAGLDVFENEPAAGDREFEPPIVHEPGVFVTHHVGASTDQAQTAIAEEAVRIVTEYASSGVVPNCVNLAAASPATCLLTVRHHNQPGVLARVLAVLSEGGINVEEMENILYDGAEAACARIRLRATPSAEQVGVIRTSPHILSADVTPART